MTTSPAIPTLDLRAPDGPVPIPLLGLGTWQSQGDEGYRAVRHALDVGYRHVDTATAYGNEDQVGRALADSDVDRGDVFVTTKLPPNEIGNERAVLEQSLRLLGTDHVDLWLIHWPDGEDPAVETWRAFRELRDEGKVRAIGVSNYSPAQIDALVDATGEAPALNQIPWSPADFDLDLVTEHTRRGVALEGYSPFKRTDTSHPVLTSIAEAKGVSVEQVVLLWHLRHRVVVIPKSTNPERIERNLDVLSFALSDEDVARIDTLGAGEVDGADGEE